MPEEVKEWISHLAAQGSLTVNDPQLPVVTRGSLTDASKRAKPDSDEVPPSSRPSSSTPTLTLTSGAYSTVASPVPWATSPAEVPLPEGVSSLAEWGRTVCELPKYRAMNWTYSEMCKSSDPEVRDYLGWISDHAHKAGRVKDLSLYLKATNWNPSRRGTTKTGMKIPGTSEARRLREPEP